MNVGCNDLKTAQSSLVPNKKKFIVLHKLNCLHTNSSIGFVCNIVSFIPPSGDDWEDPEDPTVIAENELLGAASSIDAAANKLLLLRPRRAQTVVSCIKLHYKKQWIVFSVQGIVNFELMFTCCFIS